MCTCNSTPNHKNAFHFIPMSMYVYIYISVPLHWYMYSFTVNQLLFAGTLFRDSSVINWFTTINIRDLVVFINIGQYAVSGS
jgi:hypothetical protein